MPSNLYPLAQPSHLTHLNNLQHHHHYIYISYMHLRDGTGAVPLNSISYINMTLEGKNRPTDRSMRLLCEGGR